MHLICSFLFSSVRRRNTAAVLEQHWWRVMCRHETSTTAVTVVDLEGLRSFELSKKGELKGDVEDEHV